MKNTFSTKKVSTGIRMYATKDNRQRFYGRDKDYFISYNILITSNKYTITQAYTYAVLDMYGETIRAGFINGTTEVDTSDRRAMYITISGKESNLSSVMVLDVPKSEAGENPEYIPYEDGSDDGGGSSSSSKITSFLANDFTYNESSNSYSITKFSPNVSSYAKLNDEFTVYVHEIDTLKAGSSIDLFGNKFKIHHITDEPLDTTIESVASVMPFLCSKQMMTARMLYSYVSTSQTGLGLEDLFLDVEDEPFNS